MFVVNGSFILSSAPFFLGLTVAFMEDVHRPNLSRIVFVVFVVFESNLAKMD